MGSFDLIHIFQLIGSTFIRWIYALSTFYIYGSVSLFQVMMGFLFLGFFISFIKWFFTGMAAGKRGDYYRQSSMHKEMYRKNRGGR